MSQAVKEISAKEAWEKLREGQACQVIDVREPSEYSTEHVAGSISMPLSELKANQVAKIEVNKTSFLLCGAGKRARKAADIFLEAGIENIAVIDGGLKAWMAAGYPIEH